jgi:tetratricopeptide (TPR) repeat protein
MNDKLLHKGTAALAFLISFIVYLSTMAPTVSFWDCGEFIATAYKLAIPHPPGAPAYLLIGRIFSMIPIFQDIAARINFISVLSSAFTIMFLHLIIVHFIKDYQANPVEGLKTLNPNEGFMRYIPYIGGLVGALTYTFTHSFWFNAVEAEVYAISMFFTSFFVWLILAWSDHAEEKSRDRYLILIAYLMGLAMGVHILNALVIPVLVLIVYFRKYDVNPTSFAIMTVVGVVLTGVFYPGIVKEIPAIIRSVGFGGFLLFLVALFFVTAYFVKNRKDIPAMFFTALLLVIVGYSSFLMIYIRSNLDPNIDENDPETIEAFISYINREQYGDHHFDRELRRQESPNGHLYRDKWDFFWNYQINEMYVRYFFWNFGGIDESGGFNTARKRADITQFWLLPLLLGTIGFAYHFYRDWKKALAVGTLFFMTGLAIVLYLNQPDPQPRERDYSYVGSFFAFAIWVGIGAAALLEMLAMALSKDGKTTNSPIAWVAALLLFIVPARMCAVNYKSHDRSGNFVASDYSYNMLVNADPNGIIFTNGDNDTFPLWYLQEVENVRTDVRVANLSLLNTPWYIKQLRDMEPKVPISLSDEQIKRVGLVPWPNNKKYEVTSIPKSILRADKKAYHESTGADTSNIPDDIVFEVKPKMEGPMRNGQRQGYLRVQDFMILNILSTNKFQKPLYFAVTTSDQNRLDGLKRYQRMDGLLFKITTIPDWRLDADILYDNLMNKFRYRNLNNPDVYYDENIVGLLQNYRSAFFQLASHYLSTKQKDKFSEVMKKLYEVMPPEVIPYTNSQFEEVMTSMAIMAGVIPRDSLTGENTSLRLYRALAEVGFNYNSIEDAKFGYESILNVLENSDYDSPRVHEYMRSLYPRPQIYDQAQPQQREEAVKEEMRQLRRMLVRVYRELGDYESATTLLEKILAEKPDDPFAKSQLDEIQKLQKKGK